MVTHRHAIERRSEEILVSLISIEISSADARVVVAFGDTPAAGTRYPSVTCYCVSAEEEISQTGVYRARCEVHCETYQPDDANGDILSNLAGRKRQQIQSNLETDLSGSQNNAFIHRFLLADSNSEVDGKVKRVEIGVDVIWSPTDS